MAGGYQSVRSLAYRRQKKESQNFDFYKVLDVKSHDI